MKIILEEVVKYYDFQPVFNAISTHLQAPGYYAILGNNGSGKTTLLKILSGLLSPSEGKIFWEIDQKPLQDNVFQYAALSSPALELIEEFTLNEIIDFHLKFKKLPEGTNRKEITYLSGLGKYKDKKIREYSSGMKQRVKLVLTMIPENKLVLLDEPCSNLDEASVKWYQELCKDYWGDKLVVVGSNNPEKECKQCDWILDLSKPQSRFELAENGLKQ